MQVIINGESRNVSDNLTIVELLNEMGIEGKIAVEVNQEILPRSQFSDYRLNPGDTLEIVRAIGGG
ncbi:MAG: sulfur carrier protein ThiS [Gammaproteobacteria bacterium]|nr:sulfur carrier protein ThiS [Gammaproteobacteria bacterium]